MITGIGLDIVELARIADANERSAKFRERVLTKRELERYSELRGNRRIEFLAGRFAAKEAYAKANGTGIGHTCGFQDIEILSEPGGKPVIYFQGRLADGFVSITHTKTVAAAQVILHG
ncbi:holo-[acyl-carrier-protein] synthase [Sporosarcina sp. NCCP-2222]|uniref:holo-ACP synthase n=1 Tax=Sporosarcina sp. NCCP-2222 TaxID=2935073 RepID=UPI00207DD64B|nr:holo-ACP synthase [Sporosarcina sp. NCCP-2222]GKV54821.1 holo-[acyl-carrier-protein] synthase [Sporosarcina sp. NCCP-2222]